MDSSLLRKFSQQKKQLALLIDPDGYSASELTSAVQRAEENEVDFIFIGGSLLISQEIGTYIKSIKAATNIPVIIFPGSPSQVRSEADAILLLSVISGRNAEMLIGHHVMAAPVLKASGLEILPTGYMLIESGASTTASYMSNTTPIPHDKPSIASCTAMAGEMLGLKLMYLDGGSGARSHVSPRMIAEVSQSVSCPLIVGGGIRDAETVDKVLRAGANVVVVGNVVEDNPAILGEMMSAVRQIKVSA